MTVSLCPATVREALGPAPNPHVLACIAWDVDNAVRRLEAEIRAGSVVPGVRMVDGRPLSDWLDLGDTARLLAMVRRHGGTG